jgi:hypothetical protein
MARNPSPGIGNGTSGRANRPGERAGKIGADNGG